MAGDIGIRDVSLVESKEFLQSVYNALPCGIGIYTVSENPEILFLNSGYLKIYGFDGGMDYSEYDQYTHNDFFVDVLPEERAIVVSAFRKQLETGKPVTYEVRALCKDGSVRFTRCTLDTISLPGGEQYFQEVIVDVTEEKIEDRTRELSKYSRSLMAVFDRIYEMNIRNNTILPISSKNPDKDQLRNLTNCQAYFTHQADNYIHPEDREPFLRFNEFGAIRDTVAQDGYAYLEYRTKLERDGDYQHTALTIMPVEDDYYLYGVMNIDARVKHKLLEKENRHLQAKAERDSLTGLLNRAATEEAIGYHLCTCGENVRCAMMVLDLDDFKAINDTYGHLKGDRLLIEISKVLKRNTRKGDIVGRFGGDEFIVFLTDTQGDESIIKKVQDLAAEIRELPGGLDIALPVSVSFGITMTSQSSTTFSDMFAVADKALYMAKRSGKDRYAVL